LEFFAKGFGGKKSESSRLDRRRHEKQKKDLKKADQDGLGSDFEVFACRK
jgi:hypothetical protein